MKNYKKNKMETLKKIMVKGHHKNFEIEFMLIKHEYEGISVYRVYTMLKKNGEMIDIDKSFSTFSKHDAEDYFDLLLNTYLRYRYAKIIKWR